MPGEFDLRNLSSFGDVAAEDDAVLDYFLTTDAVSSIDSGRVLIVLGRKGTGKTALVRHFSESREHQNASALSLRSYPWNVHATRKDYGASNVEAYVSSWRYMIAIEASKAALTHSDAYRAADHEFLSSFLKDNYGGIAPSLSDLLRPKRLTISKISFAPTVLGNKLGGVDLDRKLHDMSFGIELNSLSDRLMEAAKRVMSVCKVSKLTLHFDELDHGLSTLDDQRSEMLVGLILAARDMRRVGSDNGPKILPVIYLRTDIWDEIQFSDKNKISTTSALMLDWDEKSLLELVELRLRHKLHPKASWSAISEPELMRGSQTKWNHILARTFLRPRDVISFLNTILAEAKKRLDSPLVISNKDIVGSRDAYSAYLKAELDDEIRPYWSDWDLALQACSAISTVTFEKRQFEKEYNNRTQASSIPTDEALKLLYRFSVIGYDRRSGYGGSSWAFQYVDPASGWDTSASRFKVHLGLKEYAKLREERK